jgi:hypothetical protein
MPMDYTGSSNVLQSDQLILEIVTELLKLPPAMWPVVYSQWREARGLKSRPGTGPLCLPGVGRLPNA